MAGLSPTASASAEQDSITRCIVMAAAHGMEARHWRQQEFRPDAVASGEDPGNDAWQWDGQWGQHAVPEHTLRTKPEYVKDITSGKKWVEGRLIHRHRRQHRRGSRHCLRGRTSPRCNGYVARVFLRDVVASWGPRSIATRHVFRGSASNV